MRETGATTNMVRRYGWGRKGDRLIDVAPPGHWKTTTFVAGLVAHSWVVPRRHQASSDLHAPFVCDGFAETVE